MIVALEKNEVIFEDLSKGNQVKSDDNYVTKFLSYDYEEHEIVDVEKNFLQPSHRARI